MTAAELHSRLTGGQHFECMGLRLVPLTLGHMRLMDHLGCSNVGDPSTLGLAALVCSRPHGKVLSFLRSRLMPLRLMIWRRYMGNWSFETEIAKFSAYIRHNTELPIITPKGKGEPTENPIPSHQSLRVLLLSRLNYSPDSVDDVHYLQALWDVATLNVISGAMDMADMDDDGLKELGELFDMDRAAKVFAGAV